MKLFKNPRAVRLALLLIGGAFSMHCGCSGTSSVVAVKPRSFYFLNAGNGVPTARARVKGADNVLHLVAQNIGFGTLSPRMTMERDNSAMSVLIDGNSGAFNAESRDLNVGFINLTANTVLNPGGQKADIMPVDPVDTHVKMVVIHDWSQDLDVYVTAPGADIATIPADQTFIDGGSLQTLGNQTLHPNTAYQVRFCLTDTKTVIFDTGTLAGSSAGTIHAIMAVRNGTTKLTRQFVIDPR